MSKLLIVEDNDKTRILMQKVLAYFKHEVVLAADAQEALTIMKSQQDIDLIVTDLLMPHMSGEDFIRLIRAEEQYKKIPIIVVSTEATRLVGNKDVQAIVQKPFLPSELNQTIVKALAQRPAAT